MEPGSGPHLDQSADRLTVRVQNRVFTVNKRTAAEQSLFFRALLRSGMKESRQQEVHLQAVGLLGFLVLLQVLDGERPALDGDQIVEAIQCTAFLQVPALTSHLMDIVDSENCVLMFHTAQTYGVLDLSHSSALFIRDMYGDLSEGVRGLPAELLRYVDSLPPSSYVAVCSHAPAAEGLRDVQRTVCYLDEARGEWRVLTRLPSSASTSMAGVAVLDNKLYVVGGVHDLNKTVVETGFCYNPASDSWSTLCGSRRRCHNVTLIGHRGCLYAVGGECDAKPLASVERYTLQDQSWSFVAPLPRPAASVISAVAMSRIFVCLWGAKGATEVYEYRPQLDRWLLVTTLVRHHSYGLYMVAHRDNLYVLRNRPCDDFLLCVMDCYNLSSRQWTSVSGQYGNSKGSLATAAVRGDSVFTLSRHVTSEYAVERHRWTLKRKMKGFGRIGSIYTFMMRLPTASVGLAVDTADHVTEDTLSVCPKPSMTTASARSSF
ncbi:unnamed protein product [Ophioblennius macclurei]